MENPWWQGWPRNTYIIVFAVVLIVVAALVLYTYTSFREAAIELILERDQQVVVLSAARLREEMDNLADNLETLAHTKELADETNSNRNIKLQEASPRLAVYDAGVVFLDHRGIVMASEPNRPEIHGEDWSDRIYFREVLADTHLYISDAVADGPENALVVVVAVPIVGDQNQFIGALVGMFHLGEDTLSAFYASIVRLRIGQSGGTYVVDGNGRILYDTESDLIGHQITEDQREMIGSGIFADVELTEDRDGHQIVAAHAPVPGTSWTLFTEDDWDILTSSTRRYSRILLFSFAAALALPPLGLTILSRIKRFTFIRADHPSKQEKLFNRLQSACFPTNLPMLPGWDLSQKVTRADKDDGNFFFTWIQTDGGLVVATGWVEGQGISKVFALTSTRSCLKGASIRRLDPQEALDHCNEVLCSEQGEIDGVHCLYLVLDPGSGDFKFASTGTPRPFLIGSKNQIPIPPMNAPLGINMKIGYAGAEGHIAPGESLVLINRELYQAIEQNGQELYPETLPSYQGGGYRKAEVLADAIYSKYQTVIMRNGNSTRSLHVFVLGRVFSDPGGGGKSWEKM